MKASKLAAYLAGFGDEEVRLQVIFQGEKRGHSQLFTGRCGTASSVGAEIILQAIDDLGEPITVLAPSSHTPNEEHTR